MTPPSPILQAGHTDAGHVHGALLPIFEDNVHHATGSQKIYSSPSKKFAAKHNSW